jgi:4'-phosphopantetheinyl transferase
VAPDDRKAPPEDEIHVWLAQLDVPGWPRDSELPASERERAGRFGDARRRGRWTASRWALRGVLARYLDQPPAAIELRVAEGGKPALAAPATDLRFNLSHSGELAMVAVAAGREVGVDVQRTGSRPAAFYLAWTQREAIAKCLGSGLWAPLPAGAVSVMQIDAAPGYAAALAIAEEIVPSLRRFDLAPADLEA